MSAVNPLLVALPLLLLVGLFVPSADAIECDREPANADARLRKHLMCSYDKSTVPVKKPGTSMVLTLMMAVLQFEYDDRASTMDVSTWMLMSWTDEFLRWTPADHDGIDRVYESSTELWQPDLSLHNADIVSSQSEFCRETLCSIEPDGSVTCLPPCRFTAPCLADYRRWPFDTQNCTLRMGSWVRTGSDLQFRLAGMSLQAELRVSQSGQWRLRRAFTHLHDMLHDNESYPFLLYSFVIERHAATHSAFLVGPTVVIVTINLITLWLAPECWERLALTVLNILFHFTYMQELAWYVPVNGDNVPLVVKFFETSLWLTAVLLVLCIVSRRVQRIHTSVPEQIGKGMARVESWRVGRSFLRQQYLIESQPLHADSLDEDDDDRTPVLATAEGNAEDGGIAGKSPATQRRQRSIGDAWRLVVLVVDRVLFVVLFVAYTLMMYEWLPDGYLTGWAGASQNVTLV